MTSESVCNILQVIQYLFFNVCICSRNTYKQEYEKFKMFNTITILILSLISVVFPDYLWVEPIIVNGQDSELMICSFQCLSFLICLLSLLLSVSSIPGALVHCVSVWHYFTITLRELILLSNGSKWEQPIRHANRIHKKEHWSLCSLSLGACRIKRWWLMHHYLSIAIATLLLTW